MYNYASDYPVLNSYDGDCGSDGFLIDVTAKKPKVVLFGNKKACNIVTSIKYDKNELEIYMDNGYKFMFKNGKMLTPKASVEYKLSFPENSSEKYKYKDKKGLELYKKFPPYSKIAK